MHYLYLFFRYISYANLPFMLGGLFYVYRPLLFEGYNLLEDISFAFILMGFGLSLVSLRDLDRVDKISRWVMERERVFQVYIYTLLAVCCFGLVMGSYALVKASTADGRLLGVGLLSIALGMLGLIKSLIDQADYLKQKGTLQPKR
ncbi:hypothetical protein SAMN05421823_11633 [Catalinimonas alkaloidigena]|uniref:Uncharacterized protein n=1 Tax=Catalinimonas alkaloidigena TaxID=1075417 RepID=A0A1G9UDL6_9BACT|nr:hypothetical protein [Catalinimonas alkaloidigena]SDM57982.1 hypothetical protein SAMN05421823_11633 [Catalinimonas alkaloidigena]